MKQLPMNDSKTISDVVTNNWCTGCGTCAGCCPAEALSMEQAADGRYVPLLDEKLCTACGQCRRVCPPANENFGPLNEFVFGGLPDNVLLGHQRGCFLAHSADADIRFRATSGGCVTTLLLLLLRSRQIDGAVVTRLSADDPLRAEAFIARTEGEILSAIGSKYLPVPVNATLRQIGAESGRFAFVGLPCHIHGLRRAQMMIPALKERIPFVFGLVCSRTMSHHGWRMVLDKMGVDPGDIRELKFRGEGWPGGLTVTMRDGSRKTMPMLGAWFGEIFGGFFFSQSYCALCDDVLADYADIAFADAYLPEVMKSDKTGTSIVIGRTEAGQSLIEQTRAAGQLEPRDLAANRALASQWFVTLYKKRNLPARVRILCLFGRSIPVSLKGRMEGFLRPTAWDYLTALVPCLNIRISGNRAGLWILQRTPLGLLSFLRKSYKWLLMRQSKSLLEDR
jgi:coenzyme F420 hydrogenase subunit beta